MHPFIVPNLCILSSIYIYIYIHIYIYIAVPWWKNIVAGECYGLPELTVILEWGGGLMEKFIK